MITVFLATIWLTASAIGLGLVVLRLTGLDLSDFPSRAFAAFWLGFSAQLILLLGASAIVPLGRPYGLLILLGPSSLFLIRPYRRILGSVSARWAAFAGLLILLICIAAVRPSWSYDTGLYHYPLTLWYRDYGAVRGIALLHHRLGFTSSVFAMAAALDWSPFASRLIHLPCVVAISASMLYAVAKFYAVISGKELLRSLFFPIAVCILIPTFGDDALSSSPDVLLALFVLFFFWLLAEILCTRSELGSKATYHRRKACTATIPPMPRADLALILVGGAAYSVKATGLLLLVAAFVISLWLALGNVRSLFIRSCMVLITALPTALVNTITSGFPFFPIVPWGLSVSWRLSDTSFEAIRQSIIRFPFFGWGPEYPMDLWEKLKHLFMVDNALMLSFGILSLILLPYVLRKLGSSAYTFALLAVLAVVVYQLITVPVFRFNAGYLVLVPALAVALSGGDRIWQCYFVALLIWVFSPSIFSSKLDLFRIAVFVVVVGGWRFIPKCRRIRLVLPLALTFVPAQFMRLAQADVQNLHSALSDGSLWVSPPALPKLKPGQYNWSKTGQVQFRQPLIYDGAQCWATDLPCAPEPYQAHFGTIHDLRFSSTSGYLGDGFVEAK